MFDNENRNRYYGLRKGDTVNAMGMQREVRHANAIVKDYGFMDNNCVILQTAEGKEVKYVAEWCEIVKKVEDM
jgi:hypothetical protein